MPLQKIDEEGLVHEALALFRRQGYHKTTMADVAGACGLLKGSLYHYFPSKEALALAVMQRVHAHFREQVFRWAYEDSLSPAVCARHMAEETERYFLSSEGGCLMGNLVLELIDVVPEFQEPIRRYFQDWITALLHLFTRSGLPAEQAQFQAENTVAAIQGGLMMMRLFKDPAPFKRANAETLNMTISQT